MAAGTQACACALLSPTETCSEAEPHEVTSFACVLFMRNTNSQTESVYFIDRDPTHFQRVLNFMRDGKCVVPSSPTLQHELLAEATFYQVRA